MYSLISRIDKNKNTARVSGHLEKRQNRKCCERLCMGIMHPVFLRIRLSDSVSNGKHNKIAISVRVRSSPLIKKDIL